MDALRRLSPERRVDIGVALLIALFAWLAISVHDSIAGLADMARGIRDTGAEIETSGTATSEQIRTSVGSAADAIGSLPIVGSQTSEAVRRTARVAADAVRDESSTAGRRLRIAGVDGEADALSTARLVGWLAFLIPTVLLLAQLLPRRWPALRRALDPPPTRTDD